MDNSNIVKMDSKGRILIPVHIRNHMSIEEGTEMIIVPDNDKNHFKILPIAKDSTAEMSLLLHSSPRTLAAVADALSANAFSILVSESRRIGDELTEWRIIVDMKSGSTGIDELTDIISGVEGVRSLDVVRK